MKNLSPRLQKLRDWSAEHNPNRFNVWQINGIADIRIKGHCLKEALSLCEIQVLDEDWIPGEFGPCPESVWSNPSANPQKPQEVNPWVKYPHLLRGGTHNHPDYAAFLKEGLPGRRHAAPCHAQSQRLFMAQCPRMRIQREIHRP